MKTFFRSAFRWVRGLLTLMGVVFAILLVISWMQYQDRVDAGDVNCTFTHCV